MQLKSRIISVFTFFLLLQFSTIFIFFYYLPAERKKQAIEKINFEKKELLKDKADLKEAETVEAFKQKASILEFYYDLTKEFYFQYSKEELVFSKKGISKIKQLQKKEHKARLIFFNGKKKQSAKSDFLDKTQLVELYSAPFSPKYNNQDYLLSWIDPNKPRMGRVFFYQGDYQLLDSFREFFNRFVDSAIEYLDRSVVKEEEPYYFFHKVQGEFFVGIIKPIYNPQKKVLLGTVILFFSWSGLAEELIKNDSFEVEWGSSLAQKSIVNETPDFLEDADKQVTRVIQFPTIRDEEIQNLELKLKLTSRKGEKSEVNLIIKEKQFLEHYFIALVTLFTIILTAILFWCIRFINAYQNSQKSLVGYCKLLLNRDSKSTSPNLLDIEEFELIKTSLEKIHQRHNFLVTSMHSLSNFLNKSEFQFLNSLFAPVQTLSNASEMFVQTFKSDELQDPLTNYSLKKIEQNSNKLIENLNYLSFQENSISQLISDENKRVVHLSSILGDKVREYSQIASLKQVEFGKVADISSSNPIYSFPDLISLSLEYLFIFILNSFEHGRIEFEVKGGGENLEFEIELQTLSQKPSQFFSELRNLNVDLNFSAPLLSIFQLLIPSVFKLFHLQFKDENRVVFQITINNYENTEIDSTERDFAPNSKTSEVLIEIKKADIALYVISANKERSLQTFEKYFTETKHFDSTIQFLEMLKTDSLPNGIIIIHSLKNITVSEKDVSLLREQVDFLQYPIIYYFETFNKIQHHPIKFAANYILAPLNPILFWNKINNIAYFSNQFFKLNHARKFISQYLEQEKMDLQTSQLQEFFEILSPSAEFFLSQSILEKNAKTDESEHLSLIFDKIDKDKRLGGEIKLEGSKNIVFFKLSNFKKNYLFIQNFEELDQYEKDLFKICSKLVRKFGNLNDINKVKKELILSLFSILENFPKILFVKASKQYVSIVSEQKAESELRRVGIGQLAVFLKDYFIQPNRSFLINPQKIKEIKKESKKYNIILSDGTIVPISDSNLDELKSKIPLWFKEL